MKGLRCASALVVLLGACGDSTRVTLRYQPAAGTTLHYIMDQDLTVRMEGAAGAAGRQDIKMHIEYTHTVKGPTDGGTEVALHIDGVDAKSPQMPPAVLSAMSEMLRGIETNIVFDERMQVVRAGVTNQGNVPAEFTSQLAGGIQGATFPLPEHPIKVGQSWTGEIAAPTGRIPGLSEPLKLHYRVRLARIRPSGADTVARLEIEASFPNDPIHIPSGATLTMDGTMKGDLEYSVTRSAIIHSSLKGTIRITSSGGGPGDQGAMALDQSLELLLMDTGPTPPP